MPDCPTDALGRSTCAEQLRTTMAAAARELFEEAAAGNDVMPGCEITVSTAPPIVHSPYGANGYTCPHGVQYWIEPTSEQIAIWAAKRTP